MQSLFWSIIVAWNYFRILDILQIGIDISFETYVKFSTSMSCTWDIGKAFFQVAISSNILFTPPSSPFPDFLHYSGPWRTKFRHCGALWMRWVLDPCLTQMSLPNMSTNLVLKKLCSRKFFDSQNSDNIMQNMQEFQIAKTFSARNILSLLSMQ